MCQTVEFDRAEFATQSLALAVLVYMKRNNCNYITIV